MSSAHSPLKNQRLIALALCWVWCIVSACVGLNALIKANQTKSRFRREAPPGVTLDIDINDVYQSGVVLTTVCAVIAVLASIFFLVMLIWPKRATGSLKIQAWMLTFFSVWLLATQIPYTIFTATRTSKVTAFLGGLQLPPEAIQEALAASGETDVYHKLNFVVLLSIFPWISLLFTVILIVVLFAAASRRHADFDTRSEMSVSDTSSARKASTEKASVEKAGA
ncbi:hypothetical protein BC834DRAFT_973211 [Gloeopeniophorella convolvens]|nr:hypothetical protein BC834DRAFT_973211 [Gloeopeniophorella convolvens]